MGWRLAATAALGVLAGVMVGLSVSPIVTTALGAFLGIGGAVVTVTSKGSTAAEHRNVGSAVLTFSLLALLGISAGIYARTHDVLGPGPRPPIVRLAAAPTLEQIAKVSQSNEAGAVAALLRRAAADGHPVTLTQADLDRLVLLNVGPKAWSEIFEPERTAAPASPRAGGTDLRALGICEVNPAR